MNWDKLLEFSDPEQNEEWGSKDCFEHIIF